MSKAPWKKAMLSRPKPWVYPGKESHRKTLLLGRYKPAPERQAARQGERRVTNGMSYKVTRVSLEESLSEKHFKLTLQCPVGGKAPNYPKEANPGPLWGNLSLDAMQSHRKESQRKQFSIQKRKVLFIAII